MSDKIKTIEIPSEFARLFDDDWREAAVYGGRFSLKSHTIARILLIKARQDKIRVGCFREFQNSITDSSHQLLKDLIEMYELKDFNVTDKTIINTVTGSDFLFKGLRRNEQSVKSIEGIDIAWVEEAQTISEESINILTPTIRKDGSQIIYTYNRLTEEDPVHTRLVVEGRPNTLVINVNYDTAIKYGWMPEVIYNEMISDKENRPNLYQSKWLGEPTISDGRIYKGWVKVNEIPHEARLESIGVDFGYDPDPAVAVALWYYNGGYILDEIFYKKRLNNVNISDYIKNYLKNHDEDCIIIADSAEPKSIQEMQDYGLNVVKCTKGPDSVRYGISFVQDKKISVTDSSLKIWQSYQKYSWSEKIVPGKLPKPDHYFSDGMDAVRYGFDVINNRPKHSTQDVLRFNYERRKKQATKSPR